MKKVRISFQLDKNRSDIGVLFSASEQDDEVLSLMRRVGNPLEGMLTVLDPNGSLVSLSEDHVISISSDNRKLRVVADDGTFELRDSLNEVEKKLHPKLFLRISRYEIIHLGKVRKFDFSISGSLRIEMLNGMETWASRRFISEIRNRLSRKDR